MPLDIIQQEMYTGSINTHVILFSISPSAPYVATPHLCLHRIGCKRIPSYFAFPIMSCMIILIFDGWYKLKFFVSYHCRLKIVRVYVKYTLNVCFISIFRINYPRFRWNMIIRRLAQNVQLAVGWSLRHNFVRHKLRSLWTNGPQRYGRWFV